MRPIMRLGLMLTCAVGLWVGLASASSARDLKVLFLGDRGHHQPAARYAQLAPAMATRGISVVYTDKMSDLNLENLKLYDALMVYANIDEIAPEQDQALWDYVQQGGGYVPVHCATYCFRNSPRMVALMGAQFQRHGTGVFRTEIAQADHPIMRNFGGFESWDETYVHHQHNEANRIVLDYRVDEEGREPWTWIRTEGQGRVFYTAWGHDHRTWSNAGFLNLVERGVRWAAGDDPSLVPDYLNDRPFPVPEMTKVAADVAPFEYEEVGAKIPNYLPSDRWGVQGDPLSKMQKPVAPTESAKHVMVPEGFRAELFVAEPELGGKPLCMTWDEKGRLWIGETYDYPNELQPEGQGRDRIRICEDTDGDWKADKFTVFAEKLSIPTSITFWNGGVLVQNGTTTDFFRDTNGDDVADERQVVFRGWDQGDTHGGVSNFQYGLDNWIWAMQGYNYSEPQGKNPQRQGFRMGFFRFKPDGTDVEFIRSTNNNTWGFGMSEEGIIFGSTANRVPSVYMPIANRYYERVRGWTPSLTLDSIANTYLFKAATDKVRQVDQHGGYTAGAGHALYTARNYPREYWNRTAFVCEPTGHLVGTFVLRAEGADFKSTYTFNVAASDDEWTAPIMAEVGPDGNVWMLDWYNYIIQHNPTPAGFKTGKGNAYESDLRDKRHGRIYRLVYNQAPAATKMALDKNQPETLVKALTSDNLFWRRHAQRLLVERGKQDVVPQLVALIQNTDLDPLGLNPGAIHALWTLHGLGALSDANGVAFEAAVGALRHPSAGVRRNAVQVLPPAAKSVDQILTAGSLADPDAQVRLAAFLAVADQPASDQAAEAVLGALAQVDNLNDRWIPEAATAAAANMDEAFLRKLAAAKNESPRFAEIVSTVAQHYARGENPSEAANLLIASKDANSVVRAALISGLAAGWQPGRTLTLADDQVSGLEALMGHLEPAQRGQLVKLATVWGSDRFAKYAAETISELLAQVDDEAKSVEERTTAAVQSVSFLPTDPSVVQQVLDRVTPQLSPELAHGLIAALENSEALELGALMMEKFPALSPDARKTAVTVLLKRKPATQAMLTAIDSGNMLLNELSLDQRQSLSNHPDREIRDIARKLLERGGALPSADRQKVLDSLHKLTEEKGDAVAGQAVFKRVCSKCHMHSGEGNRIGPDLTGMAVHPKHELLLNIMDPNRSVESNFRTYTVVTNDGQVLTGMLASESKTAIELFNAEGEKKTVLRQDVEELIASTKSLMPEGFEKQMNETEVRDLLEFLTKRGKFVPVDLTKAATIASDRGMFNSADSEVERLIFPEWKPQTFQGVPFYLIDPRDGRVPNVILLRGPIGAVSRRMPRSVNVPVGGPAKSIHLLSGVSGWGYPYSNDKTVSMIVRINYTDGAKEEHELKNGEHFADYISHVDVPGSHLAYRLRGQQVRYLAVHPRRADAIASIDFLKGQDATAPIVMAVTVESP